MVKKVFYIEKEKFLRSMMELALRAKKAEIYTVDSLTENFYLLDDLSPDLVIFDLETCKNAGDEAFQKLLSYSGKTKLIMTGPQGSEDSMDSRVHGHLSKPIIATNLAERVLSLID